MSSASVPASPVQTAKLETANLKSLKRYPQNALGLFNQLGEEALLEHYWLAALDRLKTARGLPPRNPSQQDYIFMLPHRESAQKASERIRRLTESSQKACMESGAEKSASSLLSDDGSDTASMDKTVVPSFRITLKGPHLQLESDSAQTSAPAVTGLDQAPGSAATPKVISDTDAEEQTGGAKGSVSGNKEDDEKAAERARVRPALTKSELATRFSQHVVWGRHGVEWMFRDNEWPFIMMFDEALCKKLFQHDVGAAAAIHQLWSDTPWKVHLNFSLQLFRTVVCQLGNALERHYQKAMRHYPAEGVPPDDLLKRFDKNFKVQRWLEEDPDRQVIINDIWHRLRCGRDDHGNLYNAIRTLVEHENAVVVFHGLVSAFMVMQFVGFYAESAVNDVQVPDSLYLNHHLELAKRGLLTVAELARIHGDWNMLLEKCVLLAMDLGQRARIAPG